MLHISITESTALQKVLLRTRFFEKIEEQLIRAGQDQPLESQREQAYKLKAEKDFEKFKYRWEE